MIVYQDVHSPGLPGKPVTPHSFNCSFCGFTFAVPSKRAALIERRDYFFNQRDKVWD